MVLLCLTSNLGVCRIGARETSEDGDWTLLLRTRRHKRKGNEHRCGTHYADLSMSKRQFFCLVERRPCKCWTNVEISGIFTSCHFNGYCIMGLERSWVVSCCRYPSMAMVFWTCPRETSEDGGKTLLRTQRQWWRDDGEMDSWETRCTSKLSVGSLTCLSIQNKNDWVLLYLQWKTLDTMNKLVVVYRYRVCSSAKSGRLYTNWIWYNWI